MNLFDLVIDFDKKRNNELSLYNFQFENIDNEKEAIRILKKYIDNDKPMTEKDLRDLGLIPNTKIWDL